MGCLGHIMKQDVEVGHLEEFQGHERGNQAWALLPMLRRDILLPRRRLSRQTPLPLLLLPLPLQVSQLLQVQVHVLGARCGPHCVRTRTRPLLPPAQETLASAAPHRWRLLLSAANSGNCPRPLYISTSHSRCCILYLMCR